MEFGKVPEQDLEHIDFSLPPDGETTHDTLSHASAGNFRLYAGCAKWGRKEWTGLIYPPKTPQALFLDEYAKHFDAIELNAVFYGMPSRQQISSWKEKVSFNKDFKFCPKFTQGITHIRRLKNAGHETDLFLDAISAFEEYLGPAFLQLSDNFGPANMKVLSDYLELLPKDFDVFVEVRHKDWFADPAARGELFSILSSLGKGAVITDASGRRDCLHMELTIPKAFIRFVGNGLHPTDYSRIDDWTERINSWKSAGLSEVHFYLHQHDEKDTPVLADYFIAESNKVLETNVRRPRFVNAQSSMF